MRPFHVMLSHISRHCFGGPTQSAWQGCGLRPGVQHTAYQGRWYLARHCARGGGIIASCIHGHYACTLSVERTLVSAVFVALPQTLRVALGHGWQQHRIVHASLRILQIPHLSSRAVPARAVCGQVLLQRVHIHTAALSARHTSACACAPCAWLADAALPLSLPTCAPRRERGLAQ